MNKFISTTIILILIGFIPLSCGRCSKSKYIFDLKNFYNVYIEADSYANGYQERINPVVNDTIKNYDSIYFNISIQDTIEKIAYLNKSINLINNSYATSIRCYYPFNIKNKIDSITIFSDADYNGITAGNPLNDNFTIYTSLNRTYNNFSINNFIDFINSQTITTEYLDLFQLYFITKTKPIYQKTHQFTIRIKKENGEIIETKIPKFTWI